MEQPSINYCRLRFVIRDSLLPCNDNGTYSVGQTKGEFLTSLINFINTIWLDYLSPSSFRESFHRSVFKRSLIVSNTDKHRSCKNDSTSFVNSEI